MAGGGGGLVSTPPSNSSRTALPAPATVGPGYVFIPWSRLSDIDVYDLAQTRVEAGLTARF